MIEAVIFDLDGVIVTTDDLHFQAWKALADALGLPFDREKNNRLRGVSRMESLAIVLEESKISYATQELTALAEQKNSTYVQLLDGITPSDLLPGITETLSALKRRNIKIAVGSSSKNTKTILNKVGLLDVFDVIVDGTDISHSKPDPEVFLLAAHKLNVAPKACAVIEDAWSGIQAAKAAGMMAIAFGSDAAADPQKDYSISHPMEILHLIDL